MRMATTHGRCLALMAALILVGCEAKKQTGADQAEAARRVPEVATPVPAATAFPEITRRDLSFEGNDANGDGRIASSEYAGSAQRFAKAVDADGNGTLSVEELESGFLAVGITNPTNQLRMLATADNDGDGTLTLAEYIGYVNRRFTVLDSDGDTFLSPPEFDQNYVELPPAGASPGTESHPRAPRN